jgi:hypothetical protein
LSAFKIRARISADAFLVNVMARMLENVGGVDAVEEEVQVAIDEDVRLAGARRCLQHDVMRRIDRATPRFFVRKARPGVGFRGVD